MEHSNEFNKSLNILLDYVQQYSDQMYTEKVILFRRFISAVIRRDQTILIHELSGNKFFPMFESIVLNQDEHTLLNFNFQSVFDTVRDEFKSDAEKEKDVILELISKLKTIYQGLSPSNKKDIWKHLSTMLMAYYKFMKEYSKA
jgi:hypothetical protein